MNKESVNPESEEVHNFWFDEIEPGDWWAVSADFDAGIKQRFGPLLDRAISGELYPWRTTARGRLAEIIVLDQFSRNVFRGSAQAFAQDGMALALAQEAVARDAICELREPEREFLLMPYMHSESVAIHEQGLALFEKHASKKVAGSN